MELALKAFHIVLRYNLGMNVVFDRIVFRREPKGIKAHGIKHIVSLHPPLPCHNVEGRRWPWMPYMQSLPRRIGELHQRIIFRF